MTTLLIGGLGYVGRRLQTHLEDFMIADTIKHKSSNYLQWDITQLLPFISSDIDNVVHLAAITGFNVCQKIPQKAYDVNVNGTRNVLELCRLNDVERLVFASTCALYRSDNGQVYSTTKRRGEELCLEASGKYGFQASILRFANIYGLGFPNKKTVTIVHKFLLQALLNQNLTVYGGDQVRDFVNLDDVCEAIKYCLGNEVQGIRYVGTGHQTSIMELAYTIKEIFREEYDREVTIAKIEKDIHEEQGVVPSEHFDWGWKAKIGLKDGLKQILAKLS